MNVEGYRRWDRCVICCSLQFHWKLGLGWMRRIPIRFPPRHVHSKLLVRRLLRVILFLGWCVLRLSWRIGDDFLYDLCRRIGCCWGEQLSLFRCRGSCIGCGFWRSESRKEGLLLVFRWSCWVQVPHFCFIRIYGHRHYGRIWSFVWLFLWLLTNCFRRICRIIQFFEGNSWWPLPSFFERSPRLGWTNSRTRLYLFGAFSLFFTPNR